MIAYRVYHTQWSKGFTLQLTKDSKYFLDSDKAAEHAVKLQKQLDIEAQKYDPKVHITQIEIEE